MSAFPNELFANGALRGRAKRVVLWILPGITAVASALACSQLVPPAVEFNASADATVSKDLGLTATIDRGDMILAWNPGTECVRSATAAVLSISDGGRTESVQIATGLLSEGKLAYSPIGRDVSFRLAANGSGGENACVASVLVLNRSAGLRKP